MNDAIEFQQNNPREGETDIGTRLPELSLANILLCMMVFCLHVCSDTISEAPADTFFYRCVFCIWKLCSCAVYGFFFLSGLKSFLGPQKPVLTVYKRRARTVLLPYIAWTIVYVFLVKLLYGYYTDAFYCLIGSAAPHLYFVIALLQFYLLLPLWRIIVSRLNPIIVIPFAAVLQVPLIKFMWRTGAGLLPGKTLYFDRIFLSYILVWLAGCYVGSRYEYCLGLLKKHFRLLGCLWLIAAAVFIRYSYRDFVYQAGSSLYTLLSHIYFFLSVLCVLPFTSRLKGLMRFSFLKAIDRASYQIYLSHMAAIFIFSYISVHFIHWNKAWTCLVCRGLFAAALTFLYCFLWLSVKSRFSKEV